MQPLPLGYFLFDISIYNLCKMLLQRYSLSHFWITWWLHALLFIKLLFPNFGSSLFLSTLYKLVSVIALCALPLTSTWLLALWANYLSQSSLKSTGWQPPNFSGVSNFFFLSCFSVLQIFHAILQVWTLYKSSFCRSKNHTSSHSIYDWNPFWNTDFSQNLLQIF